MEKQYSISKLLNVFFTRELSARLGPSAPLIVTTVDPGFTVSELRRDVMGGQGAFLLVLESVFAYNAEAASRRPLYAALGLHNTPDALRGRFVNNSLTIEESSDFVESAEGMQIQKEIWRETMSILGKLDPRVLATADRFLS
ncbi:hypothetical protein B0H10DRAFT_2243839 [Mycena sp. CBHHK59/15]|nr:hypothetical protein B0H10DRAFT_2243839 [Mycena sp. CBHHK59/15]